MILEQEWMRTLNQSVYSPNDYSLVLFGKKFHLINASLKLFLKVFGRKYSHHAKIARELKERNKYIYWTVMVGTVANIRIPSSHTLT